MRENTEIQDPGYASRQQDGAYHQVRSGRNRSHVSNNMNLYLTPAAFQWPKYLAESGWMEHAPFAFWLIDVVRPKTLVELGTHNGHSYFAFCQAVASLELDTTCYAIDHWKGDEHAGFYGKDVFTRVQKYNNRHYADFSRLIRSDFDSALKYFSNKSIDILHIDGRHFYEDVKHDFESWRPKLSDHAIVVFHDTNVRERNFGVYKLWDELRSEFPSFEFTHGHGLGVLGIGTHPPARIVDFFTITEDPTVAVEVRQVYARLGAAIYKDFDAKVTKSHLKEILSEQTTRIDKLKAKLARRNMMILYITRPKHMIFQCGRWLKRILLRMTSFSP